MRINEVLNEYYQVEDDDFSKANIEDTRRPRLTLRHLNRLKKVREMKRLESGKRSRAIPSIYNTPSPE